MLRKASAFVVLVIFALFFWRAVQPDMVRQRIVIAPGSTFKLEVPAHAEISADQLPQDMSWIPERGVIEWIPRTDQLGEHQFQLKWGTLLRTQTAYTVVVQAARSKSKPNSKPSFTSVPSTFLSRGVEWSYKPTVADAGGEDVSFELKNGPTGMRWDAVTQIARWTPQLDSPIHSECVVIARNKFGLIEEQAFKLSLNSFYKISSIGDWPQWVQPLENGMMVGLTQARLILFRGTLNDIQDSFWTPARSPRSFLYHKGFVYLRRPPDGLDVLDVSDGLSIKPVGCLPLTVTQFGSTEDGAIEGNILIYPNHREYGLVFISLENPARPRVVSTLPLGTNCNPYRIITQGRIAFVSGNKFTAAVDFTDVTKPRVLSKVEKTFDASGGAFAFYPPYLYDFSRECVIVDASKPEKLKLVSTVLDRDCSGSLSIVSGQTLSIYGYSAISQLDLTNPLEPRLVKRYPKNSYKLGFGPQGLYQTVGEDVHFLKGGPLLDKDAVLNGQRYESVTAEGSTAFILGSSMTRLDMSKPGSPRIVSQMKYQSPFSEVQPLMANGALFTPSGMFDARGIGDPKQFQTGSYLGFAREGNTVYALKRKELERWVLEPKGTEPARQEGRWGLDIEAVAIAVRGETLYAAVRKDLIFILQIGTKELELKQRFKVPCGRDDPYIQDLQIERDVLYVAMNRPGVIALSVKNPESPEYYGHYPCGQYSRRLFVRNGIACVADSSGGVAVVDFSNKGEAPVLARYETTDSTTSVALANGFILATDQLAGVQILVFHPFLDKDPGLRGTIIPPFFKDPLPEMLPSKKLIPQTDPVQRPLDF